MADPINPFESLLTPESLKAKREAELAQRYKGQDFWVQEGARAGAGVADTLRSRGIGLDVEDLRAQSNDAILRDASSRYQQYVKDGKMAPDEAQAQVLQEAISALSSKGNYQAAQGLLPALQGIYKQQLERGKLKQETATSAATEQERLASAYKEVSSVPREQMKALSDVELNRLKGETEKALAGKYNREPVGRSSDRPEPASVVKLRATLEQSAMEGTEGANIFASARNIIQTNPRSATAWGPLATQISKYAADARYAIASNRANYGKDPLKTVEGKDPAALIKDSGIASAELTSLTTDLAYALARTRDPGGRLSNQDVQQAVQIVGGQGSPETKIAVLDSAFQRLTRPLTRRLSMQGPDYGLDPKYLAAFNEAVQGYGKKASPAKMTAAQRLEAALNPSPSK